MLTCPEAGTLPAASKQFLLREMPRSKMPRSRACGQAGGVARTGSPTAPGPRGHCIPGERALPAQDSGNLQACRGQAPLRATSVRGLLMEGLPVPSRGQHLPTITAMDRKSKCIELLCIRVADPQRPSTQPDSTGLGGWSAVTLLSLPWMQSGLGYLWREHVQWFCPLVCLREKGPLPKLPTLSQERAEGWAPRCPPGPQTAGAGL